MVNQSTLPTLFRAISNFEIEADLKTLHKPLMESLQILVAKFLQSVASHGDQLERIAYVSDAGKVETATVRAVRDC